MTAVLETNEPQLRQVASALAKTQSVRGEGRGTAHMVRLNRTVMALLEAAKPADQPMVEFLKEAAVTVSLQRLEASQK